MARGDVRALTVNRTGETLFLRGGVMQRRLLRMTTTRAGNTTAGGSANTSGNMTFNGQRVVDGTTTEFERQGQRSVLRQRDDTLLEQHGASGSGT